MCDLCDAEEQQEREVWMCVDCEDAFADLGIENKRLKDTITQMHAVIDELQSTINILRHTRREMENTIVSQHKRLMERK